MLFTGLYTCVCLMGLPYCTTYTVPYWLLILQLWLAHIIHYYHYYVYATTDEYIDFYMLHHYSTFTLFHYAPSLSCILLTHIWIYLSSYIIRKNQENNVRYAFISDGKMKRSEGPFMMAKQWLFIAVCLHRRTSTKESQHVLCCFSTTQNVKKYAESQRIWTPSW